MKKLVIIVIFLAIVGFGGFWMFSWTPVVDPNLIQVSGNIEIIDAEFSLKMAGRVSSSPVEEGLRVQKDDLIATLDDAELKSELAPQQAELRGGWIRVVFKEHWRDFTTTTL